MHKIDYICLYIIKSDESFPEELSEVLVENVGEMYGADEESDSDSDVGADNL